MMRNLKYSLCEWLLKIMGEPVLDTPTMMLAAALEKRFQDDTADLFNRGANVHSCDVYITDFSAFTIEWHYDKFHYDDHKDA